MEKLSKERETEQQSLFELTNEIPELVYVSNTATYDLLFVNKAGKEQFGLESVEGRKCYQALQGLDAPCPFCTSSKLNYLDCYTWEHYNPITKGHYLLKDKLIRWKGCTARLELAFDITRREKERVALSTALDAERVLLDCVRELYDADDTKSAVGSVLRQLGEFLSADRAYLIELHGDKLYNTLEWCAPGVKPEKQNIQGVSAHRMDRWKEYVDDQRCVVVENLAELEETLPEEYRELSARGVRSLVSAPMVQNGKRSGYLGVDNPDPAKVQNIVSLLQTLRYFIMASYHRAENEERLTRLSYYDTLTDLYNRNRFIMDTKAMGEVENAGVVHVNVNGLKSINDRQGHAGGDDILAECARRMTSCFRSADFYRIGGDEFIVVCCGIPREEFETSVRRLQEQMAVNDTCSAAVGAQWAQHVSDIQLLVSEASEEMYNDKRRFYRMTLSPDRYRHYNDDILGLTAPGFLRQELENGSFLVYFQPKISFQNRAHTGAEALVRYCREDGTIVSPQQFVPILEDVRLIGEVDFYVFESVCARIAIWRERGYRILPVSVNFSRYSLTEEDFVRRLEECCRRYGVEKRQVEIEITESVDGMDGFDVKRCLSEIRDAGFLVSIDDFGARYANMYLFASMRFDVLKIDKSLVDDVTANEGVLIMLEAVNGFCEKLHIETVAEGVETEEQFHLLRSIGIKQAQGYLFSRPIPAEKYEREYLAHTAVQ